MLCIHCLSSQSQPEWMFAQYRPTISSSVRKSYSSFRATVPGFSQPRGSGNSWWQKCCQRRRPCGRSVMNTLRKHWSSHLEALRCRDKTLQRVEQAVVPAATALAAIIANQTALASVLVTAYNHPSFGQPVCAHADAQDTFIFQLEGCRVWQFWHHSLEAKHLVQGPVNRSWELCIEGGIRGEHGSVHVELQPGAILWLPRGIAHQTSRCGKGVSSHWSFAASMSQLSAGHVLMDVAQASGKPEVQQKLIEALRKDNDLSVRLRQGHPSLEVTLALLDEVAPGPWPALDRRQVALRRKLLETAAGDLSMSQRTSQCRSGPLGKFLIRRKVGRRIDL